MTNRWMFDDPPNYPVITIRQVVYDGKPILYVTHDIDDRGWQFLSGEPVREEDALVVALSTIVQLDKTITALSDLPLGWIAWRRDLSEAWQRSLKQ